MGVKRRGLSSVIGMIFLVIVLSSTIGYFTYGVGLIEKLSDEVIIKTLDIQKKLNENFEIANVGIDGGKFNLTIYNTGELPINFTRIWVNNVTDNTWPLQNFTVNKNVNSKNTIANIGQGLNLQALETQAYSIKLITEKGTGKEFFINSPSQEPLNLRLIALPETVPDGFRTTLLLTVTNNMTKNNSLLSIKPMMETPQTAGTASYTLISDMNPKEISTLEKGDSADFTWTYEISGSINDSVIFTVSLQNGLPQNTATARVSINDVLLSQQSETSLSSTAITSPFIENSLIFHSETGNTPGGEYQMYPGDPDTGGTTISVETDHPDFITNFGNGINIPAGSWNSSLVYFSAPYPDSLMSENSNNMILHFEGNIDPEDSTENTSNHSLGNPIEGERPTYETTGGPHGSGAFSFDGGDYIQVDNDNDNDVRSSPDSTVLWFNAVDGTSGKQVLYHVSDGNDDDYYEMGIDGDDDVYFTFRTNQNASPAFCESNGVDYENGKWQHLAAVRTGSYDCRLYINGTDVDLTPQQGSSPGSQINSNENFIGAEDEDPNDGFNGIIDDLLHWDSHALSQSEITDLYNTNYGNATHLLTFYMNKTNIAGVVQTNIAIDQNYPLKFLDGKANGDFLNNFNYTARTSGWTNFTSSERLALDMQFVSGLDMNLRIDDSNLLTNPQTSFLQYPTSVEEFQSYITVVSDETKTLTVYNGGPTTAWITFEGTRLTFDDVASSNTFASIILNANGTSIDHIQDSIAFSVGETLDFEFSKAKNPPSSTSLEIGLITPGNYDMKMHITGYDISGKSLTRTIDFGTVLVT